MSDEHVEQTASKPISFEQMLAAATQVPGVRIDRANYLAGALGKRFSPEVVKTAIESSPAAAGIAPDEIGPLADASIQYETTQVTVLSAAAGIPGGLAMIGTVPADMVQYLAHILRIAQKLAYLYSWDKIFTGSDEDMDDEARNLIILFVGIMFGANGAAEAVGEVSKLVAKAAAKRLPQKALTKGFIYPVVKSIAGFLGVRMTKDIFAKGVAKVVPLIGAVVSGGVTFVSYAPMCLKLKDYLAGLEVAIPETYAMDLGDIDDDATYEA